MAQITLDSIREAAEKKYGSFDIDLGGESVSLLNPMRLSKEKRKALQSLQKRLDEVQEAGEEALADVDESEVMAEMLTTVCESPAKAKKLLKALGDDLVLLVEVFNQYGDFTQAGEASASHD